MTRRRLFLALWLGWIAAFVAIEAAALLACGGDGGPAGCTFSALWWRVSMTSPAVWVLMALGLLILGVHLMSRGRL